MTIKLAIASDHAGYTFKQALIASLNTPDIQWIDLGPDSDARVDYPDYAAKLTQAVTSGVVSRGVLICGTGIGMSIAANRNPQIRAALCTDVTMAKAARAHNDANVICFGARVTGLLVAQESVRAFLDTFFEGGRHAARVAKLSTCGQEK